MSDPDAKKTGGHTLADHLYGQNIVHEHGEDSDHDHDHDYDCLLYTSPSPRD